MIVLWWWGHFGSGAAFDTGGSGPTAMVLDIATIGWAQTQIEPVDDSGFTSVEITDR